MPEMPEEMAEAVLNGDAVAVMVTETANQPPPNWDWMLKQLRDMLDTDGEAMGIVLAATPTKFLMVPTPGGPHDALMMLVVMKKTGHLDSICWVAVASDTYVRQGDYTTLDDGLTPTEAFKAGLPDTKEALLASCLAPDGPGYDVQQTYTRTEDGIEWDEPQEFPHSNSGRLMDLMREVVEA